MIPLDDTHLGSDNSKITQLLPPKTASVGVSLYMQDRALLVAEYKSKYSSAPSDVTVLRGRVITDT